MLAHGTNTHNSKPGNGRTPAENHLYASIGSNARTRQQKLDAAAAARASRRARAAERIVALEGPLPPDELERAIDRAISDQMNRARAAALTARRKAREAAEREAAAEAELEAAELENLDLDATGLLDAGSDGITFDGA